jgi:cytochrome c553
MAARVLACASFHGAEGQGTSDAYFPRLAGKPSGYFYNQLVAFRDARRKFPPMNYLLEFLPDPYLKQIADHFAALRPAFPQPAVPAVSQEILAKGEALVTHGDPQRDLGAGAVGLDLGMRRIDPGCLRHSVPADSRQGPDGAKASRTPIASASRCIRQRRCRWR